MAKMNKTLNFENAVISAKKMLITEVNKDDTKTYDLKKILYEWDGIEGLSISIKSDDELPEDDGGFDD